MRVYLSCSWRRSLRFHLIQQGSINQQGNTSIEWDYYPMRGFTQLYVANNEERSIEKEENTKREHDTTCCNESNTNLLRNVKDCEGVVKGYYFCFLDQTFFDILVFNSFWEKNEIIIFFITNFFLKRYY